MNNKFLCLLFTFFTVASCNNNTKSNSDKKPVVIKPAAETETNSACFIAVHKKDTITLHIITNAKGITGDLVYHLFEKDKNTGTINGEMRGDTLIADYTFMSEGMSSVREVVFLKKEKGLAEGYGEMKELNGRLGFKNKATLNFDNKRILMKVNCAAK